MKTVFSNEQCAHVWAQQRQQTGRSGNMRFEGPTIYSYGPHYPLATFTDKYTGQNERIVLTNAARSSMTTESKHKPAVREALRELPVYCIAVAKVRPVSDSEHAENVADLLARADAELLKASRAHKWAHLHIEDAEQLQHDAVAYALAFTSNADAVRASVSVAKRGDYIAQLREKARAQAAAQREADKAREIARQADYDERLARWLAGESVSVHSAGMAVQPVALRIVGDELQTSRGARVPLDHAIKAFRFIRAVRERGQPWRRNGQTVRVGHFQIDSIDADGSFTAGCHFIGWNEVERAARLAGVFDADEAEALINARAEQ